MDATQDYCYVIEGKMALPYQYLAGAVGSRFIVALRDEKKIYGVRSPSTGQVYVPPREVCDTTFERLTDDWVEVGPGGIVTGFTIIRYREPYQPKETPYALALIQLDGADTPLTHVVQCANLDGLRVGMRVRAVFADEPVDNIMAIDHFAPEA